MNPLGSNVKNVAVSATPKTATTPSVAPIHHGAVAEAIRTIVEKKRPLTKAEAQALMAEMLSGNATDAQISALLVAFHNRGETADKIAGFAEAICEAAVPLPGISDVSIGSADGKSNSFVDTCGTGGDGQGTFNISTAAAFVLAGAGVKVTKHGNRGLSSKCGSADVLEALGAKVDLPAGLMARALEEVGIVFLFAPSLHPAVRQIQKVRREIRVKSIFNILGPLTNPARPSGRVVGAYSEEVAAILAAALMNAGVSRAMVVHGDDGLDEITITGTTTILEIRNGWMRSYHVSPEQLGIQSAALSTIAGGNPAENGYILRSILSGEKSSRCDVVLMNAAAGLVVACKADSLEEGVLLARESVDSGRALKKLNAFVRFSSKNG